MQKRFLLASLAACFAIISHAQNFHLPDTSGVYSISAYTPVIEDAGRTLTLAQISDPSFDSKWQQAEKKYSWNFTSSVFWTRTLVTFPADGNYRVYLDYNGMDTLDFFVAGDSSVLHGRAGLSIPYARRADFSNKPSFAFHAKGGRVYTIYMRIAPGEGMAFFPAYLAADHAFEGRAFRETFLSAVFYGIAFLMFLSFLVTALFTREKSYLLYSLIALLHALNRLSFSGHVDGLFGEHPLFRHYTDSLTQLISMTIVVWFMVRFLETKKYFRWQHYGLVACMLATGITIPFVFLKSNLGILVGNNAGFPIMIISTVAAWMRWKRDGYQPGKYFLVGWGGFDIGVIFLLLSFTGVVPSYFVYAFEIGIVIEMLFFSMAVAENYVLIRRQQQQAQQELIVQLQENERIKDAANRELEQKVEERTFQLSEKNREILDSIHYAKRIQYALLAHAEFLDRHLPENFVLFKPKDIVSGDFYWATRHQDKFYFAVCDSTGHGVPGAFMSLLNISFLNEAITEKNIGSTGGIFDHVRERLISHISQSRDGATEAKDGMDGTLLCIDKAKRQDTYSAAYNMPVLMHENELTVLDADKMPVGKGERQESFRTHTITVPSGAMLYLFTDGYADQFGGPKGKKFKHKQLCELLAQVSKLPLAEQRKMLEEKFEEWKGDLAQVDDVLITGIRF